jgi:hypothetical protein
LKCEVGGGGGSQKVGTMGGKDGGYLGRGERKKGRKKEM